MLWDGRFVSKADVNSPPSPAANTLIRRRKILVHSIGVIGSLCSGDRSWHDYSSFLTAFRFPATAHSALGGSKLHYGQRSRKTGAFGWVGVARSRRRMS